jgi:hypothetical protein
MSLTLVWPGPLAKETLPVWLWPVPSELAKRHISAGMQVHDMIQGNPYCGSLDIALNVAYTILNIENTGSALHGALPQTTGGTRLSPKPVLESSYNCNLRLIVASSALCLSPLRVQNPLRSKPQCNVTTSVPIAFNPHHIPQPR